MPRASPCLHSVESGPSLPTAGLSRCPPKEAARLHPWQPFLPGLATFPTWGPLLAAWGSTPACL